VSCHPSSFSHSTSLYLLCKQPVFPAQGLQPDNWGLALLTTRLSTKHCPSNRSLVEFSWTMESRQEQEIPCLRSSPSHPEVNPHTRSARSHAGVVGCPGLSAELQGALQDHDQPGDPPQEHPETGVACASPTFRFPPYPRGLFLRSCRSGAEDTAETQRGLRSTADAKLKTKAQRRE